MIPFMAFFTDAAKGITTGEVTGTQTSFAVIAENATWHICFLQRSIDHYLYGLICNIKAGGKFFPPVFLGQPELS